MKDGLGNRVAIGIAWMTLARGAVRGLGLISTLILARLLTPADFGIIAMATAVAAGLELLTLFGFDVALIQRQTLRRQDYDTAWTLNVLLALGLALGLALVAAPAAGFYREPRLEAVLLILGAKYLVKGAANTGVVDFRRNLDFRWDFLLQVIPKLGGFVVTVVLAFWLRDYRALIAGMVLTELWTCLMSYRLHPHRPRPCLEGAGELFRFSRWLLLNNLVAFARDRGATFIVGRALGPSPLGLYGIAYEVASLPATELVAPINRVLYPSYVKLVDDMRALREGFSTTLGLVATAVLPVSLGLAAVADPLVRLVLGEQWLDTIPLIALLALSGAGVVLQTNTGAIYQALGKPRLITLTGSIQIATLLPAIFAGIQMLGLVGVAWAYFLHTWIINIASTYFILVRNTPIRLADAWRPSWRPTLAGLLMYGTVSAFLRWAGPGGSAASAAADLAVAVPLGAGIYGAGLWLLWRLAGRPEGAETSLWRRATATLAALRRRLGGPGTDAPVP